MKTTTAVRIRGAFLFLSLPVSLLWSVLFLPNRVQAHVVAEVLQRPAAFDQQVITVMGQVANVITRYGEVESTTFDIFDEQGRALAILVSGTATCKLGDICKVTGLFVAQKNLILPEKIERVAERPFKSAGVLFRQRRAGGSVSGGRSLREIYIPQ